MGKRSRSASSSSSDSSSDEDDEFLQKLQGVAVSAEAVAAGAKRELEKGHKRLHKTPDSNIASRPALHLSVQNNISLQTGAGPEAEKGASDNQGAQQAGDEEGHEEPPPELGIIERRIAAALDARIEKEVSTWWADPEACKSSSKRKGGTKQENLSTADEAPGSKGQEQPRELGAGLRLFRRVTAGQPVLEQAPRDGLAAFGGAKPLTAREVLASVNLKRAKREAELASATAQQLAALADPSSTAVQGAMVVPLQASVLSSLGMDPSSLAATASKVAASLQKWAEAEPGSKKHDKRLRKAMSALAVDGSDLIRAAAALQQAGLANAAAPAAVAGQQHGTGDGHNTSLGAGNSSKSERQPAEGGAAEGSQAGSSKKKTKRKKEATSAQHVKQEGVVLEGKPWVPYDSRTAVLLGQPVAVA